MKTGKREDLIKDWTNPATLLQNQEYYRGNLFPGLIIDCTLSGVFQSIQISQVNGCFDP